MSIIAIRHGNTNSNDSANEKYRGWLPATLSLEGMQNVEKAANDIRGQVDPADIKDIHAGDLARTVQTGHELGMAFGMPIHVTSKLRDWNTGDLAGTPITPESIELAKQHIMNPDQPLPGGESYNQFKDRVVPELSKYVQSPDMHLVVIHGRMATLLKGITDSHDPANPNMDTLMQKPPIDPAGVMVVGPDWTLHHMSPVKDEKRVS